MTRLVLLVALVASLAGCERLGLGNGFGIGRDRQAFDGQNYRGTARSERGDRKSFTASVRPVSASLEGAIQAAEYEGVKHCIKFYGTSEIAWAVGPDTPREQLPIEGDTLTFSGVCVE
ncbi:hypothetical protein KUH32_12335 [Thalassococcus sp. CAU 1522]|uniref:Lipoprotein n=1 Tax=Thalassococcus arenae TaxID=2851652 RepID=A0ABS6N993_9RHOB|nr:hypothetical protein [Thalassococcus arenae]MBV2360567.1 hypothetical protein [Thalassococcus arenae]